MKKVYLLLMALLLIVPMAGCVKTYTYQAERPDQDLAGNRGVVKGDVPPPETGRTATRTMGAMDVELPAPKEYIIKKKAMDDGREAMDDGRRTRDEGRTKPVKKIAVKKLAEEKKIPVETQEAVQQVTPAAVEQAAPQPEQQTIVVPAPQIVKEESAPVVEKVQPVAVPAEVKTEIKEPIKYTIQNGDTLEKIAKQYLGDARRWLEILEANKDTLKNSSRIFPGQVIVIPQTEVKKEEVKKADEYK